MRWFIPLFLSIFALMHLYTYLRLIKPAIKGKRLRLVAVFLFILGFFSPFIWRYADARLDQSVAYFTALIGLLWMGFLLYFFLSGLFFDLYRAFVFISKRFFNINPLPTPSAKTSLAFILFLSLSLSAYSYYETLNLNVERFVIETDKLPKDVSRIKILHISDLHLGPLMGMDKVGLVLEVYKREKPHMVLSTGDLVDGNMQNKAYLADALSKMDPPLGKYAVLGNHEYYRGIYQAIAFTERAGFRLLRGEAVYLKDYHISIVGIDDDDCRFFKACNGTLSDKELLQKTKRESFVIYLKHKPRLETGAEKLFDLMLSGHTHGGVYYPIGRFILTRLFIGDRGLHRLGSSYIYISKGVGTGGPPMRLFSPPDVAVIELVNRRR